MNWLNLKFLCLDCCLLWIRCSACFLSSWSLDISVGSDNVAELNKISCAKSFEQLCFFFFMDLIWSGRSFLCRPKWSFCSMSYSFSGNAFCVAIQTHPKFLEPKIEIEILLMDESDINRKFLLLHLWEIWAPLTLQCFPFLISMWW